MHLANVHSLRFTALQRCPVRRRLGHRSSTDFYFALPSRIPRIKKRGSRVSAEKAKDNGSVGQTPPIDIEDLTDLIKMVNDSDIIDFEMRNKGIRLSLKKAEAIEEKVQVIQGTPFPTAPMPTYSIPSPPSVETPSPAAETAPEAAPPSQKKPAPSTEADNNDVPDGVQISSPMSGSFYSAPAPGEPDFVKEGDTVNAGQTVCIVEAMKLMNEIESEISGKLLKILVKNGDSIVAGQPLMIVQPI